MTTAETVLHPEDARRLRARARAQAEAVRPIKMDDGSYLVASSNPKRSGASYRVHVDPEGGAILCDCPAGSWDHPCKHAEAVARMIPPLRVPLGKASYLAAQEARGEVWCAWERLPEGEQDLWRAMERVTR